jgi:hypothetical protein
MRRLAALVVVLGLSLAPPALAQSGSNPFGPLPVVPTPTATPGPAPTPVSAQQDTDRKLLFAIGGALVLLFVVIGRVITRDARRNLPDGARADAARLREEGPHRHARQAKAKARAKTKAQRQARRQNR